MEKLCNFYEKHKKEIWIGVGFVATYYIGRYKGYRAFKKAIVDACKIVNKELEVVKF